MPERKDGSYSTPRKSGRERRKAFSIGEVFSLVIPYHWIFSATLKQLPRGSQLQWCRCALVAPKSWIPLLTSWAAVEEGPPLRCLGPKPSSVQSVRVTVTCTREGSGTSVSLTFALICTSSLSPAFGNWEIMISSARCRRNWEAWKSGGAFWRGNPSAH